MKIDWKSVDQYQRANAKEKVLGYMVPSAPSASRSQEFEKAKAECLLHLRNQIAQIEAMGFEEFRAA